MASESSDLQRIIVAGGPADSSLWPSWGTGSGVSPKTRLFRLNAKLVYSGWMLPLSAMIPWVREQTSRG